MKKTKRILATIVAAATVLGMLSGCGNNTEKNQGDISQTVNVDGQTMADNGMTYETGLPITKEKVELSVYVISDASFPNIATSAVWDYVEEKTNIRLNITVLPSASTEKVDLMFTNREYPDLLFDVGASVNQISDAAEAGDLVELGSLLEKYAPTWAEFLGENETVYKQLLARNGKLYNLPFVDFAPTDRGVRDVQYLNKQWMEELNLKTPTTVSEFTDVLRAFKKAAGTGSIPENVMPYHFQFDAYVKGQFDIYGWYGVYCSTNDYLIVEDGVVKNQSVNPALKEPLKYLNMLYEEGLILPEVFTDSGNTFLSRIEGDKLQVGAFGAYSADEKKYIPYGPLDAENGSQSLIRSQAMTANKARAATITAENKYPIATLRLMEWLVSDMEAMQNVSVGMEDFYWEYDEEGKINEYVLPVNEAVSLSDYRGAHNYFVALKTDKYYENFNLAATEIENTRQWAYYNLYEGRTYSQDMLYTGGTLQESENNRMTILATDLNSCRKLWLSDFITGTKDIDTYWDKYVEEMKKLGIEEYVELKQKAYDLIH